MQRALLMLPCSSTTQRWPAAWWSPSTFWVTTQLTSPSLSISASARWAGFGLALNTSSILHLYHSHTSFGSLLNASGVASSSGLNLLHSPSGPRNVGTPLSAETPAPVSTRKGLRSTSSLAALASSARTPAPRRPDPGAAYSRARRRGGPCGRGGQVVRLLLVTGRRAAARVREAAERLSKLTGWRVDVYVAPIDVAALMPASMLRGIVERVGRGYDAVVVSGMIGYRVDTIGEELGVRVVKGPEDPYDLVVVAEAGPDALRESIESGRFEVSYAAERWARSLAELHDRAEAVEVCGVRVPLRPPPMVVVAEVYASGGAESVAARASELLSRGADVVAVGFGYEHAADEALRLLRRVSDEVGPVAVDAPSPRLAAEAVRRGYACVAMSATLDNGLLGELPRGAAAVVVPAAGGGVPRDPGERVALLERLVAEARRRGVQPIADPVLDPPLSGLAASLVAYYEAGRRLRDVPLLAGVANVYELLDADTHGVVAVLAQVLAEAGVSVLLASEESDKAYMAVTETSVAATMASIAMMRGSPPKDLGVDLLVVKEKKRAAAEPPSGRVERVDADAVSSWRPEPRLEGRQHVIYVAGGAIRDIVLGAGRPLELVGTSARSLYKAVAYLGLARDPEHLAYLGYELCKAEMALELGRSYRQDEPLLRPAWSGRVVYSARRRGPLRLGRLKPPERGAPSTGGEGEAGASHR